MNENVTNESLDALFGGTLSLYQSRSGYRFSLDALLLAYFVRLKADEKVVDLGTGNGVIPLILAHRYPWVDVTGVELQQRMVDRAQKNIRLNKLQNRLKILRGDVRAIERVAPANSFHAVLLNPPFRKPTSGRISLDDEKRVARHEIEGGLGDFLRAAAYLLPGKGRVAIIYGATRMIDLLAELRHAGIEPKRLRMVHSFVDTAANLVLVEGVKDGRGGVEVLAPLIIYRSGGNVYSTEVARMMAGREGES